MLKKILTISMFGFLSLGFSWAKYGVWGLDDINIVSREERGADESLKYSSQPEYQKMLKDKEAYDKYIEGLKDTDVDKYLEAKKTQQIYDTRNQHLQEKFLKEMSVDSSNDTESGNKLRWTQAFKNNKVKIIVHHTANEYSGYKTADEIKGFLRGVYHYHAITNGWGDIGYNFVIDQFGNIYEGRSGGVGAVGAHARRNNVDSIGIALIGNFNNEEPTTEAINALVRLSSALAQKYSIDPYTKVYYHKESSTDPYLLDIQNYAIVGHRDAGKTACPGENLYSQLDNIRMRVHNNLMDIKLVSYNSTKSPQTLASSTKKQEVNVSGDFFIKGYTGEVVLAWNLGNINSCEAMSDSFKVKYCSVKDGKMYVGLQYISDSTGLKQIKVLSNTTEYTININLNWDVDIQKKIEELKTVYKTRTGFKDSTANIQKISYKIDLDEAKKLLASPVKVFLYEASVTLTGWDIGCDSCTLYVDGKLKGTFTGFKVAEITGGNLKLTLSGKVLDMQKLDIMNNTGFIYIKNYNRKSYAGIPWNYFRGNMYIKKDKIKHLDKGLMTKNILINQVSFDEYMRGIGEISEQQGIEKLKAMALIIKGYTLFYINKKNVQPSIVGTSYNAIDDPRMFQKYVGAGLEKTFKKWYEALDATKSEIIMYNGYVPVLPYFNCSGGFTWSGKEKYGWTDTPYLKSVIDAPACADFNGHGVGLSGNGAQSLAEKGYKYKDIIKYYYDGIDILKM